MILLVRKSIHFFENKVSWEPDNINDGIYLIRLKAGYKIQQKKVIYTNK